MSRNVIIFVLFLALLGTWAILLPIGLGGAWMYASSRADEAYASGYVHGYSEGFSEGAVETIALVRASVSLRVPACVFDAPVWPEIVAQVELDEWQALVESTIRNPSDGRVVASYYGCHVIDVSDKNGREWLVFIGKSSETWKIHQIYCYWGCRE